MKKKIAGLILAAMMLTVFCVPVQAEEPPTVFLNGRMLSFDVPPTIENGRVLVPIRAIFEAMGAVVSWNASTGTATGVKDGVIVIIRIGSIFPTINGEAKTLDVAAQIVNGRTLAPLRFVGEAFGGSVSWDPDTRTVSINSGVPIPIEYETYTNTRFGYSLSYPNIFDASMESDNGDGISTETAGGLYRLKIWGAYNINNSSGQELLTEAKNRVSHISSEYAEDNFYRIVYGGGGNGQELTFYECGYIWGDKICSYILTYPSEEEYIFAPVINRMTDELAEGNFYSADEDLQTGYIPLLNALCLSEVLHYDNFVIAGKR